MHSPPRFGKEVAVKLHPRIFQFVCSKLEVNPTIDLFASADYHQLPRYFTADSMDPQALGINAFNYVWVPALTLYANPPWSLIGRVVKKALKDKSNLLLVTPEYPSAPWQPLLLKHTVRYLTWTQPLYLTQEGHLRPKPVWDTRFTVFTVST
jgi:hypothetical protein